MENEFFLFLQKSKKKHQKLNEVRLTLQIVNFNMYKFVFRTRELKYKFFFHKLKAESSLYKYVKFYFSRVCRTHKIFQLFIKLLLKKSFFCKIFLFCLVHLKLRIF